MFLYLPLAFALAVPAFSPQDQQTESRPDAEAEEELGADVPLTRFTNSDWPNGLDFGDATGLSFGDYDADGWVDVFVFTSAKLWRNVDGITWALAADLNTVLPDARSRYGSAFGDYNNDGLPDIGTEPRKSGQDECFHLLKNLGGGNFTDVATDPAILDVQPCSADSESIAWGDVDGDGDLDMFLPVYPEEIGSIDNQFLHNLGPTGPNGAYRFSEISATSGLKAPAGAARPEGVQLFDSDHDGDLDLYSNGHLYENLSSYDSPLFSSLRAVDSGIKMRNIIDEGTIFTDYDMDGDYDLLISYTNNKGLRLWEAYGDGSYFEADRSIIENFQDGAAFGLSAADWDNDGDFDFQAQEFFRRNMYMETRQRQFLLVTDHVDDMDLRSATPSWADWDKDGDQDMAIGNGMFGSYLYENDLYGESTPLQDRRYVRIRVLRDSSTVPQGLETEFGAHVEIHLKNEINGPRRQQFVSSASGYLNQNEYTLSFALPEDPYPENDWQDVRFDVTVDFPSLPEQGFWRVDKFVNPALGNINLAALGANREISVFRSGKVIVNTCELDPQPPISPALITSTGGLITPTNGQPLAAPTDSTSADEFVGIEIDTGDATHPLLIKEIFLDALPGNSFPCGGRSANLRLWDVTQANAAFVPSHGAMKVTLDERNRRGRYRANIMLQPNRVYRLVVRADRFRGTPISGPVDHGVFKITGGLHFNDSSPCNGREVASAALDETQVYVAVRISTETQRTWIDLGGGQAGSQGLPILAASGEAVTGTPITLSLSQARAQAEVAFFAGSSIRCDTVNDVLLIPAKESIFSGYQTDSNGRLSVNLKWPARIERTDPVFVQAAIVDPVAVNQYALSNALAALSTD